MGVKIIHIGQLHLYDYLRLTKDGFTSYMIKSLMAIASFFHVLYQKIEN